MSHVNILMAKIVIAILAIATATLAGTAQMISYQGFLTEAGGQPITGDLQMVFTIYDAPQDGNTFWSSGQVEIHVEDGIFSYVIGEDPQLPPGCFADTGRWLGIQILPDSEMIPRTPLTSVPYSHQSLNADTAEVGGGWTKEESQRGTLLRPVSTEARVAIGPEVYSGKATSAALSVNTVAPGDNFLQLGDSTLSVGSDGLLVLFGSALVVRNSVLGTNFYWRWSDDIVVESEDAVLGLYSSAAADFGSGVSLSEVGGDSMLTDKWAILRETDGGPLSGSGLRFTYGTNKNQANNSTFMRITRDGNVGIGTTDPGDHRLYVKSSGIATLYAENTNINQGYALEAMNTSPSTTVYLRQKGTGGFLECVRMVSGSWEGVVSIKNNGRIQCPELELTGGSDVAEPFEISGNRTLQPGALTVIDEHNPGKLKLSDQPYDTRVAGIVSGAGGINPGITLTQQEAFAEGQNVAIGGRVYCLADASFGAIRPGDLLTTSPTPGHAMKAIDRDRSHGAVIGKAMTGLEEGQGLVLVLVNLQ